MKLTIKLLLCGTLVLFALAGLAAVFGSLGVLPVSAGTEEMYVLRACDSCVAVYAADVPGEPVVTTDIPLSSLPAADRLALALGVEAEDYAEAISLLEDFGS